MADNASTSPFPNLMASPKPYDYNPSAWNQRIPIALIALAGFVISVYMGLFQWKLIGSAWDPVFGNQTELVLTSDVSHRISRWVRVPDAILGATAYLGDVLFALAGSTRRWQYRPWLVLIFGFDVIPLGVVSAVLVMMQAFVVGSWCFLCLVTAAISLVLVYLAYDEIWVCLRYLKKVHELAPDRKVFWSAFWGRPSETAHEAGEQSIQKR